MATSISIEKLPTEIVSGIFDYLSQAAPSEVLLHEQPHGHMLRSVIGGGLSSANSGTAISYCTDLKSISCVSKRWRSIILPTLFRNVIWRPDMDSLKNPNFQPVPMLRFLLSEKLNHYVITFTLMVEFAPAEADESQLHRQIEHTELEWLWDKLFSVIDPLRFTIMAPPATLAALMNRMLFLTDAWSFDITYHILSLARSSRESTRIASGDEGFAATSTDGTSNSISADLIPLQSRTLPQSEPESSSAPAEGPEKREQLNLRVSQDRGRITLPDRSYQVPAAPASPLFTLRPWTSVLLNEGSSIRAYHTYEFFLRQPPSMLSALLGIGEFPNNEALLPSTIVDFNYIAVFPLASHVTNLLSNLPKLDRLFIQLTPRPSNHILQDQKAMRNIDMADLWMERNTAYSHLFSELTQVEPQGNWETLKVFESGDAADKESWNMAVDFLKRRDITNWVVERDGVLVKIGEDDKPNSSTGTVVHHLLGEESLKVPLL